MRRSVFLLTVCCSGWSTEATPDIPFAEDLFPELGGLMELAARDGRELQLNALRMEEREGDLDVTRGQRRPQVRAHARMSGAYEMRDDISNRFRGSVDANLGLTQPLYHWGTLERRQSVAEERVALEEVDSTRRSERHFMDIRSTYLRWLLMQEQRKILQQSIALSESFVNARRQLVDVGQSSEQDVLEVEARLLENYESLSYIESSILSHESRLANLVGPGFESAVIGGNPLSVIQPMDDETFRILSSGVRNGLQGLSNPEIQRYSMLADIESEQLEILDKENLPKVDLVAGIHSDHLDSLNNEDFVLRVQYYAGVQVNWSIFNGWQTDGYKRSTLARKRAYALREDIAREGFVQQAENLLANLQLNLKQIEARGKRAAILERRQELVREQVERNILPAAERMEVEIDVLNVRQRLMESRVNYLINLMELGLLMGLDPAQSYYNSKS